MTPDPEPPAKIHALHDRASSLSDSWHRVSCVWIAIANAAGLAAVAQQVMSGGVKAAWLLPSGWLFFAGLVATGYAARALAAQLNPESAVLLKEIFEPRSQNLQDPKLTAFLRRANLSLLWAGAAFVLGVAGPLVGLTLLAIGVRI